MKSFRNYTGVRKRLNMFLTHSTLYHMWKFKNICYVRADKCGLK